ncbi:hypothetical protein [Streptomyces bluensis]|uniref:hypothetical protein n=1 Tax=Streptomyces bluensis TaxID=33897 RepID=UPI003324EE54
MVDSLWPRMAPEAVVPALLTEARTMTMHLPSLTRLSEYARGLMDFGAFARSLVQERPAAPQDDLISELLYDGKAGRTLISDEFSVQVPTLIFAGHMTCAGALGRGCGSTVRWRACTGPRSVT